MNRPRNFRRNLAAMLGAMGIIAAPTVASGTQGSNKDATPAVAQAPQAVQIERRYSSAWHQSHPIWLGIAKHGKGRKNGGTRARWDYRR